MSMQNPTISATSQFIKPYDTLPNVLYTNPTTVAISKFTKPFDILPNPILATVNAIPALPISAPSQFNDDVEPTVNWDANTTIDLYNITNYEKDSAKYTIVNNNSLWNPNTPTNTNITIKTVGAKAAAFGLSSLGGFTGIPYVSQVGQSLFGAAGEDRLSGEYVTLPANQLTKKWTPGILYPDFRSRFYPAAGSDNPDQQVLALVATKRLDGASALLRGSFRSGIYAAATALPVGPYSAFNLEATYGWGEHDNPNAIRTDFTLQSHVATSWKAGPVYTITDNAGVSGKPQKTSGYFNPTTNPIELATPFRGDKVTVIDFAKRKLSDAYKWKPSRQILGQTLPSFADLTQDFIKFYFTGPRLSAGNIDDIDDIIVFRAVITSFSENFNPAWTDVKMIGRADPNYIYTGLTRDMSIDFDIYATDRDELKPIYRKLNALAGYTAPTYDSETIAMEGPWMRITIGDLYVQTPVVMTSLGYTYGMDAPWEINIEDDPTMMQVPKKISVSCGFNVITDYLPQKGGRFWTLAKQFESDATAKTGNDNWLSDSLGNIDGETLKRKKTIKGGKIKGANLKSPNETATNDQLKFQPPNVLESDGDFPLP